jgi:predicted AlkP superfamily pyrophosphatase or phosphodiesterase
VTPTRRLAALTPTLLVLAAVAAAATPGTMGGARAAAAPSRDNHIDYVVAISVDGLNPEAIRKLGRSGTPYLHRLMAEGASTLNARTSVESTSTLPNHTSMLTSRKISVSQRGHGVMFNDDKGRTRTVHKAARGYVASVFDVVHDSGRRTKLFTSKDKFAVFNRSWDSRRGAVDRTGRNNGRDKISAFVYRASDRTLAGVVRDDLRRSPAPFNLVHFSQTDKTGHQRGFMSQAYLNAVKAVDAQVGVIVRTIAGDRRLRDHTALILTSDHGGLGKSHSTSTSRVNYTIPFMVWGKGIAKNDLYAINPGFRQPGTGRPGYSGAQPIRNGAVGNLATDLLDLRAIPRSHVDNPRTLNVFG